MAEVEEQEGAAEAVEEQQEQEESEDRGPSTYTIRPKFEKK